MIFTKQLQDLQHSINKMALPVFVVDLDEGGEFRLVALNTAHSRATGLDLEAVVRKTPQMILPKPADAEFLVSQYRACLAQRKPIVYSTRLTYRDTVKEIRTILHPVSLDGRAPTRLVGQVEITMSAPKTTVKGALGDQGVLAKADIQAIRAILDNIRDRRAVCSKDLMLLGVLTRNRSLTLSELAGFVANFDKSQRKPHMAEMPASQEGLADLPRVATA